MPSSRSFLAHPATFALAGQADRRLQKGEGEGEGGAKGEKAKQAKEEGEIGERGRKSLPPPNSSLLLFSLVCLFVRIRFLFCKMEVCRNA